ncbi:uncharacterized protein GGS25DRAFT_525186 [Hypoxylon fragiforme]|uniref:uncharacterized protein n=1 Tax=Hypoxylon fragiforme TaxID=63214 RepID=UPI0020C6327A|nr:uncharacterized protein GGS25DRAFT_525186 [Hypoxylon fragiforme]KAI2603909.1 hypothetical protein GGS25DRAFT_525186 [Hypoxylon fragiforme]
MKGRPVDQLVYECMFPKPRTSDPQNFHTLLHRSLIPEVRQEVHSFYGHLDTQEAKYPGLDYTHRIHRIRLSRWPWHRRLFRAFDALRLTNSEIANLTKWEGTRWAKERFERDSGIVIHDTAFDDISEWVEPEDRPQTARATQTQTAVDSTATVDEDMEGEEEEEDSDGELTSVGVALNERLRERAARHEAGDTSLPLDEEWEQWLKNAIESGELPFLTEQIVRESNNLTLTPQTLFPPRMLNAARAGHWGEIPDFLHGVLRYALENEPLSRGQESPTPNRGQESLTPISGERPSQRSSGDILQRLYLARERETRERETRERNWRRNYSDLRLPASESSTTTNNTSEVRLQRTAQSGTQTYISLP